MKENKQRILHFLLAAIQATEKGQDLLDLTISEDSGIVTAEFEGGRLSQVEIEDDSGWEMIRDIANYLNVG